MYRSLHPVEITKNLKCDLAESASLVPSCLNNQPCRYIFVHNPERIKGFHSALSKNNAWAHHAFMINAVFSKPYLDCSVRGWDYNLFDMGMATVFLIFRETKLGLAAHTIAGFNEEKVKDMLEIPKDMK